MRGNNFEYELSSVKMLVNPVTSFTGDEFLRDLKLFRKELRTFTSKARPNYLIAERFMNRGSMRGATGELVSMMLGIMACTCKHKDLAFITAAQWKNAINKVISLDELYDRAPFIPHAVDAICIGLYAGSRLCEVKPFTFLDGKGYNVLLKRMEILNASVTAARAK